MEKVSLRDPGNTHWGKEVGLWKGKAWEGDDAGMHSLLPSVFKHSETFKSTLKSDSIATVIDQYFYKNTKALDCGRFGGIGMQQIVVQVIHCKRHLAKEASRG